MLEARTLTDGGQTPVEVAHEIAAFLGAATSSLEIALYDLKLGRESGGVILPLLAEQARKGVSVRLVFNKEHPGGAPVPPPPQGDWYRIDAVPGSAECRHSHRARGGRTMAGPLPRTGHKSDSAAAPRRGLPLAACSRLLRRGA